MIRMPNEVQTLGDILTNQDLWNVGQIREAVTHLYYNGQRGTRIPRGRKAGEGMDYTVTMKDGELIEITESEAPKQVYGFLHFNQAYNRDQFGDVNERLIIAVRCEDIRSYAPTTLALVQPTVKMARVTRRK